MRRASEVGIMLIDESVLVVAFFAVALKPLLWSMEEDVVGVDVELDRIDLVHLDDSWLRLRAGSRARRSWGLVATALHPRSDRR
jgi:hypothetical protein